jgi:hypothetical protein
LDAVSIYSDVLTASEVLSNYNAANIELQTRVGADTSPDDGSWDAWAPVTSETQIEDFEGSTTWSYEREIEATNSTSELTNYQVLVEVDTATIISAGKMNSDCSDVRFSSDGTTAIDFWLESGCDTSTTYFWVEVPTIPASSSTNIYLHYGAAEANSVSSIEDTFIADSISHFTGACPTGDANCNQTDNHTEADDVRLNKTVSSTSTVTTINDGTGADNFFRRYRFLFVADTTGTHNFGVNSDDGSEAALFPQDGYGGGYNTAHPYGAHTVVGFWYGGHGSGTCGTSGTPGSSSLTAGQGYWIDYLMTEAAGGQLAQMCINEGSGYLTVSTANFPSQVFGRQYTSGAEPSVGSLGSEAGSSYSESIDFFSIDSTASISQSSESVIKVEGTGSQKLELGQPQADASTVALWHLDETNGNNAEDDVFDATANNNDGEFNGTNIATAVVDGVSGKARNFNGSDDFIDVGTSSTLEPTSALTVEAWVKRDAALADFDAIFSSRKNAAGEAGNFTRGYLLTGISGDNVRMYIWDGAWQSVTSDNALAANQWYHVAGTWDGSTIRLYINGVQQSTTDTTGAIAYPDAPAENHYIGKYNDGGTSDEWKGMIDEVRISDVARSAEEIAEAYRMGKDHYISKTISSTDLSAKKSLPFYIAADRPGTYLEATIGEGSYENYLSDSNTVGFWSFEEIAEDSCNGNSDDVCDRSGSGYNGDETGSSIPGVSGARGLGRKMAEADHLDFGTPDVIPVGTKTIDFWIMPTGSTGGGQYHVLANGSGTTEYGTRVSLDNTNFNVVVDNYKNASGDTNFTITSTTQLPLNKWSHVAFSWDNTTTSGAVKIYINGKLDVTGTADATESNAGTDNFRIGNDETIRGIVGSIDEVRISNAVRSAQEIRTAYETTKRTHPITIDFAASLDSGNLIADSADLSFTVDATSYGLENMGSMLFMGDKIIVRETVDDTQYIAQGTITAVTESTGAVTVSAWDSGGTFPSSGFTTNASVFKWQREYFDISNLTLDSFMDGITNLTFRVTNGNEGRTVWLDDLKSAGDYLTTPGGSTITSSTGNQYFQYRAIMTSLDEAVSATLSAVTLDYETNTAPNTPTLDSPADTAIDQSLLTVLKTTATDDDSDYLRYKIELCTNEAMDAGCQTFDQTVSQTGWSGQDAETSTAYASGTQATYTIQTALDPATTYYWRSYAIDPGGTNTFGSTQGTPYSFTTESTPDPPTACYLNKATDNSSITVHWTDNSSNEDYFYLQRNVNSGGFSDLATTIAADSTSYQDSAVSDGNTYQYRVRSYIDGPSYSDYCTTTTVSLDSDYFNFEAVDIEYVEIN